MPGRFSINCSPETASCTGMRRQVGAEEHMATDGCFANLSRSFQFSSRPAGVVLWIRSSSTSAAARRACGRRHAPAEAKPLMGRFNRHFPAAERAAAPARKVAATFRFASVVKHWIDEGARSRARDLQKYLVRERGMNLIRVRGTTDGCFIDNASRRIYRKSAGQDRPALDVRRVPRDLLSGEYRNGEP